ncbi:hypothetical protein [Rachiplusia nu nucleopolyhedrovirus]|uniref:Uncharacterized protein n=1 Tax=Rachiplusia nu nucleopolyhedrovirus TaxID=2605775 RepID=A0AAE6IQP0_9ABAC|nr:hypothetical protein QKQ55_gp118 [Rachiplusia nu nucleopolyhedrovirus]QEI03630.1 hypothetical protein [Rachiplusia nu nucleopolyhedrovirus]
MHINHGYHNKQFTNSAGYHGDNNDKTHYYTSHTSPAVDRFNNLYKYNGTSDSSPITYSNGHNDWHKLNVVEKTHAIYEKCKLSRPYQYHDSYRSTVAPSPHFTCEDILKISNRALNSPLLSDTLTCNVTTTTYNNGASGRTGAAAANVVDSAIV